MTQPLSHLDADELLYLAIEAATRDAHADAIEYLKRAVSISPDYAKARYMLGAEYAQIAMFDRAAIEMARAVEMAPTMHIARFQLGLLQITAGDAVQAESTWKALADLGEEHALLQFACGLLCLANNDLDGCGAHLSKGIELNSENSALNEDMNRVLQTLQVGETDANAEEPESANHIFLSAYKSGTPH